jgi:hypothetical protein
MCPIGERTDRNDDANHVNGKIRHSLFSSRRENESCNSRAFKEVSRISADPARIREEINTARLSIATAV